jgi:ubiquinone/menaquinone biosynthesis C-methylase UbiE
MADGSDRWLRWLLDVRFGGDAAQRQAELTGFLYPVRDSVLARARLAPGDALLDVGAGDGLIAFGALDRTGPDGRVIFSDISQDLLDHCQRAAAGEGLQDRCTFVRASADDLAQIADATADVVTTRSVLIYVKNKAAAFAEFFRVLKPGGRISLFEPINCLMSSRGRSQFSGYDAAPVAEIAAKVISLYESLQPAGVDPMVDFDDRDLVALAEAAGFDEVDLELQVSVRARKRPVSWELFLRTSGNPLVPTIGEALDRMLSEAEIARFTEHLKPLVESGKGQERRAVAYVTAAKA